MDRRGQALVEFVLILPVFLLILFVIVDFGNIFYNRYELQNQGADIVRLIKNGKDVNDVYSKVDIDISSYKGDYEKVTISKEIRLITPFMDRILGNPYLIKVERVIPDDKA